MTSHSRFKITNVNAKSLAENNYSNRDYLDMRSTLNTKTDFRKVKKNKKRVTEKLFARTGGFSKYKKGNHYDEDDLEKENSLSQIFNEYDL